MKKTRILIVFGTRPEAIKMAPLVKEFKKYNHEFDTKVCITAQHREMLDQVLLFFDIKPDFDLDLMRPNQNLYQLSSDIIMGLKSILEDFKPNYVFVHGDTTTTMASGIAAFYSGSKICHIEAGLRTFDMSSPFPEEMNRCVTGVISHLHFAPTETSKSNLLRENKPIESILVTGNTVIDALKFSVDKVTSSDYKDKEIDFLKEFLDFKKRIILVTGHRRENHGQGFIDVCKALRRIAEQFPDIQIVYPVHLNPNVQKPVYDNLGEVGNIFLTKPLSYPSFVWLMEHSYIIITDSGGIQEEAPSLGKPVLVMRETTERPEAVTAGTVKLVGTNPEEIFDRTAELLNEIELYDEMSRLHNPYGDGKACVRIVNRLLCDNE